MSTILEQIAADKRLEVARLKGELTLKYLRDNLPDLPKYRFHTVLADRSNVNIIAELKKASPSRGVLIENFDPAALARQFKLDGAVALSVLTESKYFLGSYENLLLASNASGLPVLCKDFVLDEYQVVHARYYHADAVLLIVALLDGKMISRCLATADEVGMDCLVEVHDEVELAVAIESGAKIIGVNNRNLRDFSVNLEISEELADKIPGNVVRVAESGIFTRHDVVRLQASGYNCFLVGEALAKAQDSSALIQSLRGI